ncbi:X-Pro dipeptidyl-peptidase (S15 family) protein [Mycobacterium tuberculosis]|nr:X-Pro dipeptidyl-peptidase (S15 family) protein [Mycobacterium tuberculosis]
MDAVVVTPEPVVDLIFEHDAEIEMRDGTVLRADVFRPLGEGSHPVLLSYGGYGKDLPLQDGYPTAWETLVEQCPEVLDGSSGRFMCWEHPDPERWIPFGYALVRVDARGTGRSPGVMDNMSATEAEDVYDAVEWAAAQPWSTGKVGLAGISYMAIVQWTAASLKPPHLAALCAWEGAADWYRDLSRHGGILSTFPANWFQAQPVNVQYGLGARGRINSFTGEPVCGRVELTDEEMARNRIDLSDGMRRYPLEHDYYRARSGRPEDIEVPMLSAGNWGGQGLHLRGNVEAFVNSASEHKWLELHGGNHWAGFYSRDGVEMQRRFYDYFLKGEGDWEAEPPVHLRVRHVDETFTLRKEHEWPLARTAWQTMYLDLAAHRLDMQAPQEESAEPFDALGAGIDLRTAPFEVESEITGPLSCRLWISSSTTNADVFLVLRLFDPTGDEVLFEGAIDPQMPLTQGWLRATHRELDETKTLPYRPFHPHTSEQPLTPGEAVELAIEIWPTSIVVPSGYSIGLSILGRDFDHGRASDTSNHLAGAFRGVGPFMHNDPIDRPPAELERTRITVLSGPEHASHLLVPVIPGR